MTLPSTLIFDYPTARQLAQFFEDSAAASSGAADESAAQAKWRPPRRRRRRARRPSASSGLAGMLPSGPSTLRQIRHLSSCGGDGVTEVPPDRWELAPRQDNDGPLAKRIRWGAFCTDIELFDNAFFAVSPAEASAMDPQQRLLLEKAYEALHGRVAREGGPDGHRRGRLRRHRQHDFDEVDEGLPRGRACTRPPAPPSRSPRAASPSCSGSQGRASRTTPPARRRWSPLTRRCARSRTTSASPAWSPA